MGRASVCGGCCVWGTLGCLLPPLLGLAGWSLVTCTLLLLTHYLISRKRVEQEGKTVSLSVQYSNKIAVVCLKRECKPFRGWPVCIRPAHTHSPRARPLRAVENPCCIPAFAQKSQKSRAFQVDSPLTQWRKENRFCSIAVSLKASPKRWGSL